MPFSIVEVNKDKLMNREEIKLKIEKMNRKIQEIVVIKNKKHKYYIDFETDDFFIEIKGSHKWYFEDLNSGKLEIKNIAAEQIAHENNKKFLFLLDDLNFENYLEGGVSSLSL